MGGRGYRILLKLQNNNGIRSPAVHAFHKVDPPPSFCRTLKSTSYGPTRCLLSSVASLKPYELLVRMQGLILGVNCSHCSGDAFRALRAESDTPKASAELTDDVNRFLHSARWPQ